MTGVSIVTPVKTTFAILALLVARPFLGAESIPPNGMVRIEGGSYTPLYATGGKPRRVPPFFLDIRQVTNGEFLEFVRKHPEWRRSRVPRVLADASYLAHWKGDLDLGQDAAKLREAPVVNVSWFAAGAFLAAQGKRLPTEDEWEFAARADAGRADASRDPDFTRKILDWYARSGAAPLPAADAAEPNFHGVRGLHGVVWEWVQDFNTAMVVGDSRADGSLERKLYCGAGALNTTDVNNYAAYMRYAFRASLKGAYAVSSLGFRGAKSEADEGLAALAPAGENSIYALDGTWRDQAGHSVKLSVLRGRVQILSMGFASCRFACPRMIADMKRIEHALGSDVGSRAALVFVSIDPARDTPQKLAELAREKELDPAHWTLLTGAATEVRTLAALLGFKYQDVDGEFAHSNLVCVIDENGVILHRTEGLGDDLSPIIAAVRQALARAR